jgi:hypothetical protein
VKPWMEHLAHLRVTTGLGVTELATELRKSRATVYRALERSDVQELMDRISSQLQDEMIHSATDRDTRLIEKSWAKLEEIIDSEDAPISEQRQAAVAILKGKGELVEEKHVEQEVNHGVVLLPRTVPLEEWNDFIEEEKRRERLTDGEHKIVGRGT